MTISVAKPTGLAPPSRANWGAVYALTLCVSTLVASEFMPVSLLTPIARDLSLTEGQAGQAIAVSGVFAVIASLLVSSATYRLDRRVLLLWLTVLMLVSGIVVAIAPNFTVLMLGRALVGIVIGGFWSLSAAVAMRLVPDADVPRALAVFNGGNALATTVAAPLGSFLGQYIGWRGAFFCVVPLAALTFVWLLVSLPSMASQGRPRLGAPFAVLRRPNVPYGIAAVALFFMAQFGVFTYLRPFLEGVTRVGGSELSILLLVLGLAGLLGTYLIGRVVNARLHALLVGLPLAMAAIAVALTAFGASVACAGLLLALWGLVGTAAPVAWWTWLARTVPDDAEAGGGVMVAVVQMAITAGAAGGGLIFDAGGYEPTFTTSGILFCLSASVALLGARAAAKRTPAADNPEPSMEASHA
ncbi:MFS transporter [Novosphingobium sp. ZW T3_23]|uniref:MFS transporter n=1 Tax=Novosphingobium sp. ZW T3_23 TaxID=3378084 RepID=UPI003851848C